MKNKFWEYRQRSKILREMGFTSYSAYLASDLWKVKRQRQLNAFPDCFVCGRRATQVHHVKYLSQNMKRPLSLKALRSVCAICHRDHEITPDGRKRPLKLVNRLMQRSRKRRREKAKLFGETK